MELRDEEVTTLVQQKKNQFRVEIRRKRNNQVLQLRRILQYQNENFNNQSNKNNNCVQHFNFVPSQTIQEPLNSLQLLEGMLQEKINSHDDSGICQVLSQISKLLSAYQGITISSYSSSNLPIIILSLLNTGSMKQRILSSQIIVNFTTNSQFHSEMLIKADLLPSIMKILNSREIAIAEGAIQILNNVLQNHQTTREIGNLFILNTQLFQDLCYFFTIQVSRSFRSSLILVLFTLTQSLQIVQANIDQCKICIPFLQTLLQLSLPSSDSNFKGKPEDLLMSARIISHISETKNQQIIDDMCNSGVHIVLTSYLKEKQDFIDNKDLLQFVVHCLRNLSTGNFKLQQKLLNQNILPPLLELLQYPDKQVKIEVYQMINTIVEGGFKEIQILDMKILMFLEKQFESEKSEEVRFEIIRTLINIISNFDEQKIIEFLESTVLSQISQHFTEGYAFHQFTEQFLKAIHKMIVCCCQLHQEPNHYLQLFKESQCFQIIQDIFLKSKDTSISMLALKVLKLEYKIELI